MEIRSKDGKYLFQTINNLEGMAGTSNIMSLSDSGSDDYCLGAALLYGRLRTLFGEPVYETDDFEDLYTYVLRCSKDGSEVNVRVYFGPTGPAVGGMQDEQSKEAAAAIQELIREVEPADYSLEGYYFDGPSHIRAGVKNGQPYWEETGLSEAEVLALYKERYEDFPSNE